MFLKCRQRRKNGKLHRSWSIVESRRVGQRVRQQQVLYLGEVTDQQRVSWERAVHVIDETSGQGRQLILIPRACVRRDADRRGGGRVAGAIKCAALGAPALVGCLLAGGFVVAGIALG